MLISELVQILKDMQEAYGDIPVLLSTGSFFEGIAYTETPEPSIVNLSDRSPGIGHFITIDSSHLLSDDLPKAVWL